MELVRYDNSSGEYTVKMSKRDFLDLVELVEGVYSTSKLQDFTALGVTEDRVLDLSNKLISVMRK